MSSEPTQTLLTPIPNGNYKCGSCTQCNSTIKTYFFRHPHTGQKIPIRSIISCKTKGVIYLITCSCGKAYVGQTKRQLKQHIAEHHSSIRCKNIDYPVAAHLVESNHPISSLKYTGIEHIALPRTGGNIEILLLQREAYWISCLKTLTPSGLNIDFDLRLFL